jgi:predicted XRE-type DNA-binding protein
MITVGEFAKTHNITSKDVLELARDLGFPLKDSSDELSDDAKQRLMSSLHQHLKRVALKDIKKVSSVVGGDRSVIQVVTKRRDFKPFDVQALKNKIRTEKKEENKEVEPIKEEVLVEETKTQSIVHPIEPIIEQK